jgi:flagellar motor protein MotB
VKRARPSLFPVNVWPPMVDALTLALAAFVVLMMVAAIAQRSLLTRLRDREHEMEKMRAEKERIERRLRALAPAGLVEVEEGKVIMQGEVLFDSGSDELTAEGRVALSKMAPPLADLLRAEPDEMLLVGGHTDDKPIHNDRFASNWELSTARAVAVARILTTGGLSPNQVVASGFGPYHPRVENRDDESRRRNRRIEVLIVPIRSVASR